MATRSFMHRQRASVISGGRQTATGRNVRAKKKQIDVVVVVDDPRRALFTATKLETSRGIHREQSRMSKNEPWRRSSKLQECREREREREGEYVCVEGLRRLLVGLALDLDFQNDFNSASRQGSEEAGVVGCRIHSTISGVVHRRRNK